jgi:predicted AlkP superfamily phosphohydrolase/phosphomutase
VTSRNPAKHDIFGFIDRKLGTYEVYIPNASDVKVQTIWEWLSRGKSRVASINVPVSYPPKAVNGIMVGCFLAPKLEGATYPPDLAQRLESMGYKLDADPWLAHEDRGRFMEELLAVLEGRRRAGLELLREGNWDVFQLHIMETDRLNHFFWRDWETGKEPFATEFIGLYQAVDRVVGELVEAVGDGAVVLIVSDHGFCSTKKAVFINTWLQEQGWLVFEGSDTINSSAPSSEASSRSGRGAESSRKPPNRRAAPQLRDIGPQTRAYALDPARIYINVKGREAAGSVEMGEEYNRAREELAELLMSMRDPDDGSPIVKKVYQREELYRGVYFDHAPDLVVEAYDGYDLRGRLGVEKVFDADTPQVGMHTYDNAFWLLWGARFADEKTPSVMDGAATILALLGAEKPRDLDGVPRAVR